MERLVPSALYVSLAAANADVTGERTMNRAGTDQRLTGSLQFSRKPTMTRLNQLLKR